MDRPNNAESLEILLPETQVKKERKEWTALEYYLINLGACVGIGSVWRFSYLMFQDGGGIFFLINFLMTMILSLPCINLLVTIGQSESKGILACYETSPENPKKYWGLAITKIIYVTMVSGFYNFFLIYSSIFIVNAIFADLPWIEESPIPMLSSLSVYFENEIISSNLPEGIN
jgi:SNF family Na+-dependent transporter